MTGTKDFLQYHLVQTEQLLALVSNHPIMAFAMQQRVEMLKQDLAALAIKQTATTPRQSGDNISH